MCDEFEAFADVPGAFFQIFDDSDPDFEEVEFPFAFDDDVVEDSSSGGSDE